MRKKVDDETGIALGGWFPPWATAFQVESVIRHYLQLGL